MTQSPPNLITDFNLLDDNDVLWVARDELPDASARQWVILRDGDENQCLGRVKRYDKRRVYIHALLDTWQDADPVSMSLQGGEALVEVLTAQVRRTGTGRQQVGVGVNTDE